MTQDLTIHWLQEQRESVMLGAFIRKRAFDIVFSLLVITLLLSWVIPLLALLIKLDSRGPVFFKQLRTGKDGKPFSILKFRTMSLNEESDMMQANRNDKRITRLGAMLRKTSLDELPQFINVLRGEMSIVGPRPHMLHHTVEYSKAIDYFMSRHQIMPGITGLAQVSGHRGETKEVAAMIRRVNTDIYYIYNWSFLLDMKIVLLTVWHIFRKNEHVF